MIVKKAIFPVAGLGTRFLPATKAQPKEMLVVVDKPLIQYAVEEAYEAGIRQMIFVTGRNKRSIEDHFDDNFELNHNLESKGKTDLIDLVNSIKPDDMECIFIRQPQPRGLGDAVLQAKSWVGNEPFAVLLADDLMVSETRGVLGQMIDTFTHLRSSIVAVSEVPTEEASKYGIVSPSPYTNNTLGVVGVSSLVEKPNEPPSNMAVMGRYVLHNAVMAALETTEPSIGGEVQLTDAINKSISKAGVFAFKYDGERYDCGDKLGFLKAQMTLGLRHPELGDKLKDFMSNLVS